MKRSKELTIDLGTDPPTLGTIARAWLKRCEGDTVKAIALMQQSLERDGDLLRHLVKAAVAEAVGSHVGMAMRSERAAIMRQTTVASREGVHILANGLSRALLDLPLANGVKLRSATRGQVLEQAARYEASATDMSHKARWLTLIAQHVPDDQIVGKVMTDGRAAELWVEVSGQKEAA